MFHAGQPGYDDDFSPGPLFLYGQRGCLPGKRAGVRIA
ncbi:hypothetical protein BM43_628 [Burkholderia gladioli]|jgi:hypothetical protein|uniref:Uncharacterized protein n=1 Tax=Burkholderia gladioli TaxID=28095 RepID=A0AAW3FB77_BURGA|nr:hypothetical protein BM43_628 [Burkholderia gladioli]TWC66737.1 hypothetical protein FB600_11240 [Burkholderia sp. SJZ089]TWC99187.1 hypothetical protein FBX98_11240 [Burkholderia sp. SJZ115]TWD02626.1 hypothetical protein FB601_11240 [Burkholderia sp. SJZ091]KAF1062838.1 hypothetical protein LvStA_01472 [Burkholderia gladioli]